MKDQMNAPNAIEDGDIEKYRRLSDAALQATVGRQTDSRMHS